jgi:hypothetical protein
MGRPKTGETPKVRKNVSIDEKAATRLDLAALAMSEKLGFRPTISQTILLIIKHYERTEDK